MVFLGYEKPVEQGREQVFDPVTAQMVLNANRDYINAVYNDYRQSLADMKEFNKEYGDFLSPIAKDMDWYNKNVTGRVRNFINDLYARGIDPLRSAEGRALVTRELANMPIGGIANVRQSAKIAEQFLAAEQDLRRKGLYDPLLAKYEGPSLSEYSTMGDKDAGIEAMGVWERTSPTPIQNIAAFGNPYFEGMKPNIHKRSKNGITYSEESITMDDLRAIADSKYNELVKTPQGQLMYKYYRDLTGSDEAARTMFNEAIANGQQRRIYVSDDYDDNYFKFEQLKNAREQLRLQEKKINMMKQRLGSGSGSTSGSGASSSNKSLVSYYEPLYQNLVINTLNKDPMRSTVFANNEFSTDMGASILGAQRNIAQQYFGPEAIFGENNKQDLYGGTIGGSRSGIQYDAKNNKLKLMGEWTSDVQLNHTADPSISNKKWFKNNFNRKYRAYLDQFTAGNSSGFSSMFADTWKQGSAKVDALTFEGKTIDNIKGQNYVTFSEDDINSIYSAKELSARMAGITGPVLKEAIEETKNIRNILKGLSGVVMKAISPIGAGDNSTGQYGVYANVRFKGLSGTDVAAIKDAVLATPFMSTPNPNAVKDDILNLQFDQSLDLERKLMDNKAVRGLGVSSNSGSLDNTLPDTSLWYDYDFDFDDFND